MPPPGPPGSQLSPDELAAKLSTHGPVKQEPALRGLLAGMWLFDTLEAEYVWEHPYFPYFYVPISAVDGGNWEVIYLDHDRSKGFVRIRIEEPNGNAVEGVEFTKGRLENLVRVAHTALDAWFIEDDKAIGIHPKDPFKRVDCHTSSREVRVEVDGVVVARSTNNVFLYETGLRPRYYLSPSSVFTHSKLLTNGKLEQGEKGTSDQTVPVLLPSKTSTVCPYKGQASYYHLRVGGRLIEDAIWYYTYPTTESAATRDRLCFYNEKVDVFVDGVKEE